MYLGNHTVWIRRGVIHYTFGLQVNAADGEYHVPKLDACSIAIVISGEANVLHDNDPKTVKKLSRGIIGFIPANAQLKIRVTSSAPLVIYRAFPNTI